MAPPTPPQILSAIDDLLGRHVTDDDHALFEYDYLATHVRRCFGSTSPAVRERMNLLIGRGDLVQIRVSHGGYVTLTPELESGMWMLYFGYHRRREYDPQEWGLVTAERQNGSQNLWANGDRWLYTTAPRLEKMVAHFTELKKKHLERRAQKAKDADARFWSAVEAVAPDTADLLDGLRRAVPGVDVTHRLHMSRLHGDRPCVSVEIRTPQELAAFMGVLRRGLAEEDEK